MSSWADVKKKLKEAAERRTKYAARPDFVKTFYLREGDSAEIQFIEHEPVMVRAHSVEIRPRFWRFFPCIGEGCPLCIDGTTPSFRVVFNVVDFRGTWDRDKGAFDGKPIVKIWWMSGTTAAVFEKLSHKELGLNGYKYEVTRFGSGSTTTYLPQEIEERELTKEEMVMAYDRETIVTPLSREDLLAKLGRVTVKDEETGEEEAVPF